MDARRNQTYTGLYEFDKDSMHILQPQCAVGIDEIIEQINTLKRAVIFLGDGVPVFESYISENCKVPYDFAPAHMNKQRAASVAVLAETYLKEGKTESAAEHRPDYLRLSQAERERLEQGHADH
jgi:tRNA A37 threonylcarbamoyladenosine modification protein TsaB